MSEWLKNRLKTIDKFKSSALKVVAVAVKVVYEKFQP